MGSNSGTRRFEYRDEKSSKFWEISVAGNSFTVRYGKIGADGQSQSKEFADAATAEKQAQKLIAEKMGKGYQEIGSIQFASSEVTQSSMLARPEPNSQKKSNSGGVRSEEYASEKSYLYGIPELTEAISHSNANLVARILDRGVNPNTRFGFGRTYGMTPLHLAAETAYRGMSNHAFLKVVPMLYEATVKNAWGWGRLIGSNDQEQNSLAIISMLLSKGANPLALNGEGLTPIEALLITTGDCFNFRQNDLFGRLFGKLVPSSGSASSLQGNLLRALGKLTHERFQNGWSNFIDNAYELELDHLYGFFDNQNATPEFSESEKQWYRHAISMAYLQAYEESGAEPTHSSIGKELFQNRKAVRSGWKRASAEMEDAFGISGEPFEVVADFCIEYCRRQPGALADVFEATSPDTPVTINPDLPNGMSSAATNAWLAVLARVTDDPLVIDRLLKIEEPPGTREALRCNAHLGSNHIDVLAGDGVDASLASNPAVPANKLSAWAKNEDPEIRKAVAENASTPVATLAKLSKDGDLGVQESAKQEIAKREGGTAEAVCCQALIFGDDPETRIRLALINNDIDEFARKANASDSSESLSRLLNLVCAMPVSAERRLAFASHLLEKCAAASVGFIEPLIDSFIADLGRKNAEVEAAATRDLLLRLIVPGSALDAVSAELQCKLYDFHRKGRKEASEVLFALVEQGMPIRHLSRYRADKDGASFMEKAIHNGDMDLVSRVVHSVRKMADAAACDALGIVAVRKSQEMLDLLLSDGAERYASPNAIKKAVNKICYPDYGNPKGVESLQKLIAAYRKLVSDEAVTTMLFENLCGAVENGYADLVDELIRNGAPVDHRKGNVTFGDLLGSFFGMNPKDRIFMTLIDAGLDLNHASATHTEKTSRRFSSGQNDKPRCKPLGMTRIKLSLQWPIAVFLRFPYSRTVRTQPIRGKL